jgi:hypothetical protein
MRFQDSGELYNTAVDVTSLPGMFSVGSNGSSGGDDLYNKAQQTTEMGATLLSTAIGKRRRSMIPFGNR